MAATTSPSRRPVQHQTMKHPEPFWHEPAPPGRMGRWLAFALTLLTIGLVAGVYYLHHRNFIDDGLLPSMICFIVAAAIGAFAASDIGKQRPRRPYGDCEEVAPPPELYNVWPLTFGADPGRSKPEAGNGEQA